MKKRNWLLFLLISLILGLALTAFYQVHEQLPPAVRAPSSLILAPVAMVDGFCYVMDIQGIYDRPLAVFLVNWTFGWVLCFVGWSGWRWWINRKQRQRKNARPSQTGKEEV